MTALPTRKLESYRYADTDALGEVWSSLAAPEHIEIAAQQKLQQIWLPGGDEIDVRRLAMKASASAAVGPAATGASTAETGASGASEATGVVVAQPASVMARSEVVRARRFKAATPGAGWSNLFAWAEE